MNSFFDFSGFHSSSSMPQKVRADSVTEERAVIGYWVTRLASTQVLASGRMVRPFRLADLAMPLLELPAALSVLPAAYYGRIPKPLFGGVRGGDEVSVSHLSAKEVADALGMGTSSAQSEDWVDDRDPSEQPVVLPAKVAELGQLMAQIPTMAQDPEPKNTVPVGHQAIVVQASTRMPFFMSAGPAGSMAIEPMIRVGFNTNLCSPIQTEIIKLANELKADNVALSSFWEAKPKYRISNELALATLTLYPCAMGQFKRDGCLKEKILVALGLNGVEIITPATRELAVPTYTGNKLTKGRTVLAVSRDKIKPAAVVFSTRAMLKALQADVSGGRVEMNAFDSNATSSYARAIEYKTAMDITASRGDHPHAVVARAAIYLCGWSYEVYTTGKDPEVSGDYSHVASYRTMGTRALLDNEDTPIWWVFEPNAPEVALVELLTCEDANGGLRLSKDNPFKLDEWPSELQVSGRSNGMSSKHLRDHGARFFRSLGDYFNACYYVFSKLGLFDMFEHYVLHIAKEFGFGAAGVIKLPTISFARSVFTPHLDTTLPEKPEWAKTMFKYPGILTWMRAARADIIVTARTGYKRVHQAQEADRAFDGHRTLSYRAIDALQANKQLTRAIIKHMLGFELKGVEAKEFWTIEGNVRWAIAQHMQAWMGDWLLNKETLPVVLTGAALWKYTCLEGVFGIDGTTLKNTKASYDWTKIPPMPTERQLKVWTYKNFEVAPCVQAGLSYRYIGHTIEWKSGAVRPIPSQRIVPLVELDVHPLNKILAKVAPISTRRTAPKVLAVEPSTLTSPSSSVSSSSSQSTSCRSSSGSTTPGPLASSTDVEDTHDIPSSSTQSVISDWVEKIHLKENSVDKSYVAEVAERVVEDKGTKEQNLLELQQQLDEINQRVAQEKARAIDPELDETDKAAASARALDLDREAAQLEQAVEERAKKVAQVENKATWVANRLANKETEKDKAAKNIPTWKELYCKAGPMLKTPPPSNSAPIFKEIIATGPFQFAREHDKIRQAALDLVMRAKDGKNQPIEVLEGVAMSAYNHTEVSAIMRLNSVHFWINDWALILPVSIDNRYWYFLCFRDCPPVNGVQNCLAAKSLWGIWNLVFNYKAVAFCDYRNVHSQVISASLKLDPTIRNLRVDTLGPVNMMYVLGYMLGTEAPFEDFGLSVRAAKTHFRIVHKDKGVIDGANACKVYQELSPVDRDPMVLPSKWKDIRNMERNLEKESYNPQFSSRWVQLFEILKLGANKPALDAEPVKTLLNLAFRYRFVNPECYTHRPFKAPRSVDFGSAGHMLCGLASTLGGFSMQLGKNISHGHWVNGVNNPKTRDTYVLTIASMYMRAMDLDDPDYLANLEVRELAVIANLWFGLGIRIWVPAEKEGEFDVAFMCRTRVADGSRSNERVIDILFNPPNSANGTGHYTLVCEQTDKFKDQAGMPWAKLDNDSREDMSFRAGKLTKREKLALGLWKPSSPNVGSRVGKARRAEYDFAPIKVSRRSRDVLNELAVPAGLVRTTIGLWLDSAPARFEDKSLVLSGIVPKEDGLSILEWQKLFATKAKEVHERVRKDWSSGICNDPREMATYQYLHCLAGRFGEQPDWDQEKIKRSRNGARPGPTLKALNKSLGGLRNWLITNLSDTRQWVQTSVSSYASERWARSASGSAGQASRDYYKDKNMEGLKRTWLENTPAAVVVDHILNVPHELRAKAHAKMQELAKTRAIYAVGMDAYLPADWLISDFEKSVKLKGTDLHEKLSVKMKSQAELAEFAQSKLWASSFDFEDFNSQHRVEVMREVILGVTDYIALHATDDTLTHVRMVGRKLADCHTRQFALYPDGDSCSADVGLFSGDRFTTLINTVLNVAYTEAALRHFGLIDSVIRSYHHGDDYIGFFHSEKDVIKAHTAFIAYGVRAQMDKQMVGCGRFEYLRDLYWDTGIRQGSLCRAIATTVCGNWERNRMSDIVDATNAHQATLQVLAVRGMKQRGLCSVWAWMYENEQWRHMKGKQHHDSRLKTIQTYSKRIGDLASCDLANLICGRLGDFKYAGKIKRVLHQISVSSETAVSYNLQGVRRVRLIKSLPWPKRPAPLDPGSIWALGRLIEDENAPRKQSGEWYGLEDLLVRLLGSKMSRSNIIASITREQAKNNMMRSDDFSAYHQLSLLSKLAGLGEQEINNLGSLWGWRS